MNALLPEQYEVVTIANLLPGEVGWVVPWAMRVDSKRRCWLATSHEVHPIPHGTAQMQVRRQEDRSFAVSLVYGERYYAKYYDGEGSLAPVSEFIESEVLR